jgi:hypothetical protein
MHVTNGFNLLEEVILRSTQPRKRSTCAKLLYRLK